MLISLFVSMKRINLYLISGFHFNCFASRLLKFASRCTLFTSIYCVVTSIQLTQ